MAMSAGKMRSQIVIQRQTGATDTSGNEKIDAASWATFATVWAHIDPWMGSARAGREVFSGDQIQGLDYTRMHLRFVAGLRPKDRVQYTENGVTRTFDIQAVNNRDEKNEELEIICKELQ